MKHSTLISLAAALLLGACVTSTDGASDDEVPDAKERGRLSTKMVNLSSAVNTYFSDLSGGAHRQRCYHFAKRHPSRQAPAGPGVRALRDESTVSKPIRSAVIVQ